MGLVEKTFNEGYKKGLEHALMLAEFHKEYNKDIGNLLNTLKSLIEKESKAGNGEG